MRRGKEKAWLLALTNQALLSQGRWHSAGGGQPAIVVIDLSTQPVTGLDYLILLTAPQVP